MRGTLHVLATIAAAAAVMQPAVLAQGTSPWVDAVANLSTAFTGPITLPGGKNQARATRSGLPRVCESWQTARHKMGHFRGVALATTVLKCVPRTFRNGAQSWGKSGLPL